MALLCMISSRLPLLLVSLLFAGCGQPSAEKDATVTASHTPTPAYTITQVTSTPGLSKVNIDVLLPEKVSEAELRQIAQKIKAGHDGYAKTWIAYYLPGMKPGAGAWATTHFTPNLEVQILGASKEQEVSGKQRAGMVKGDVVGRWYEEQYTHSTFVLYRRDGVYRLKTIFDTGQASEEKMVRKGKVFTYQPGTGYNGEYFKLLPGGGLGMFNQEGKMFTQGQSVEP